MFIGFIVLVVHLSWIVFWFVDLGITGYSLHLNVQLLS